MKRATRQILTDILNNETDEGVLNALKHLLAFSGEVSSLSYEKIFSTESITYDKDKENIGKFHDYRLNWISLKNFRSVPYFGDTKPYGLSFENNNGDPISLFLVGRNSSGKTTVFSALERHYVSANSMSIDMLLEENKILTYGFEQIEGIKSDNVRLSVKTKDGDTTEDVLFNQTAYCSPAPFCSEHDLHQLGDKGKDLRAYILSQLGYGELEFLKEELKDIANKEEIAINNNNTKKESDLTPDDYNEIIKHLVRFSKQDDAKTQIENSKPFGSLFKRDLNYYNNPQDKNTPFIFTKYWDRLKMLSSTTGSGGLIAKLEKNIVSADSQVNSQEIMSQTLLEKIENLYRLLEYGLQQCVDKGAEGMLKVLSELFQRRISLEIEYGKKILHETEINEAKRVITIARNIVLKIEEKEKAIIEQFKKERFIMLKEILKIFSNNDGELFIKEWKSEECEKPEDKERLTIMIKKQTDKGDFEATPQEFYNSFRYKLYAVSFKIALAFTEMKLKNIRVPIVIDDVFNASDFENNIRLG